MASVLIGAVVARKRDGARYKVASVSRDGMCFLTSTDGIGWPSMWEPAQTVRDEYNFVGLHRNITEEQARAAQSRGATRALADATARGHVAREKLADELGLDDPELLRDERPGMWTRVYAEDPQP